MNHQRYKELLALDALDAVDANQRSVLREHLAGCLICRADFRKWREVAAMLAYEAVPAEPSREMRLLILQATKPAEETRAGKSVIAGADHQVSEESLTFPWRVHGPSIIVRKTTLWLVAAAASVLLAGTTTSSIILWLRNNQLRSDLALVTNSLRATQETINREREHKNLVLAINSRVTTLRGTIVAPHARAKVIYDRDSNRALLLADGLPGAPEGRAYQIWFIVGGRPLPGGTFTTDLTGQAEYLGRVPESARDISIFAVTLEPSIGASSPTGDKYLHNLPS